MLRLFSTDRVWQITMTLLEIGWNVLHSERVWIKKKVGRGGHMSHFALLIAFFHIFPTKGFILFKLLWLYPGLKCTFCDNSLIRFPAFPRRAAVRIIHHLPACKCRRTVAFVQFFLPDCIWFRRQMWAINQPHGAAHKVRYVHKSCIHTYFNSWLRSPLSAPSWPRGRHLIVAGNSGISTPATDQLTSDLWKLAAWPDGSKQTEQPRLSVPFP